MISLAACLAKADAPAMTRAAFGCNWCFVAAIWSTALLLLSVAREALVVIGASATGHAPSTSNKPAKVAAPEEAACKREVSDCVVSLRVIRATDGPKMGDQIRAGYLSEAEIEKLSAGRGPCAAAKTFRAKVTPR